MKLNIHESWNEQLKTEFAKPYFKTLADFVKREYATHTCYPSGEAIFSAFNYCPFEDVKVVLLGQDPYHGVGQAHGLSFSVPDGIASPPSLVNIFKEIATDLKQTPPANGNLERWAKQGVLLLNATLTVRAHQAGSHQNKGWEQFTDTVISAISARKEHVVFLLWGGYAKRKSKLINTEKHLVLTSGHPSPLSANRGYWFGNKNFSKTNVYLQQHHHKGIVW